MNLAEFKSIEQTLNKLCSQHDEYMGLMQIADYLPTFKHLAQNSRQTQHRISTLEQAIADIEAMQTVNRNQQAELGCTKRQKFKRSIAQIELKLQDYVAVLSNFEQSLKTLEREGNHFPYHKDINRVNSTLQSLVEEEGKLANEAIAEYKNDLEARLVEGLELVEGPQGGKEWRDKRELQEIARRVVEDELEGYDKLRHEIALCRLEFSIPPLFQFTTHNCKEIKQVIISLLSLATQTEYLSRHQSSILSQEYSSLHYRVKALKANALTSLLQLYQQSSSKREVNELQENVGGAIKEVQNRLALLKDCLAKIAISPSP